MNSIKISSRDHGAHANCPFCKDVFAVKDKIRDCNICNTRYHEECAIEIGHCALLGCSQSFEKPTAKKRVTASSTSRNQRAYSPTYNQTHVQSFQDEDQEAWTAFFNVIYFIVFFICGVLLSKVIFVGGFSS